MPTDLFQRAHKFYLKGNIKKAEDCCIKSIANDAGDFESYNLLGVIAYNAKKTGLAHTYLKKSIDINSGFAEGYNNLGGLYKDNLLFEEAKIYFTRAIELKPEYSYAHYNLGLVLQNQIKYDEAITHYKRALEFKPDYAEVYNNIANILVKQGKVFESAEFYKKSIEINPHSSTPYLNLARAIIYTEPLDGWKNQIEVMLNATKFPEEQRVELLYCLSIAMWLENRPDDCERLLQPLSKSVHQYKNEPTYKQLLGYTHFLRTLIAWYKQNPDSYSSGGDAASLLYFIGESHSLTCTNKIFKIGKNKYKCHTSFILGCKIWHLISSENPKYKIFKIAFDREIALIPKAAPLIMNFGEIDCRYNEGLFKRYTNNNISWKESTDYLIPEYFKKIILPLKERGYSPLVWGTPAVHQEQINKLYSLYRNEYIDFIKYFNERLKHYCEINNIGFVDNYSITSDPDGVALNNVHLDHAHLKPDIFIKAIENTILKKS